MGGVGITHTHTPLLSSVFSDVTCLSESGKAETCDSLHCYHTAPYHFQHVSVYPPPLPSLPLSHSHCAHCYTVTIPSPSSQSLSLPLPYSHHLVSLPYPTISPTLAHHTPYTHTPHTTTIQSLPPGWGRGQGPNPPCDKTNSRGMGLPEDSQTTTEPLDKQPCRPGPDTPHPYTNLTEK